MSHSSLKRLEDEEFLAEYGFIASPRALHRALSRSPQVRGLREALSNGAVSELSIRRFVSGLLRKLEVGQLFPYDVGLAAIAIALETRTSAFVDEFLRDLAKLERPELPMAIRVAKESLQVHMQMPGNKSATRALLAANGVTWQESPRFVETHLSKIDRCFEYGAS